MVHYQLHPLIVLILKRATSIGILVRFNPVQFYRKKHHNYIEDLNLPSLLRNQNKPLV